MDIWTPERSYTPERDGILCLVNMRADVWDARTRELVDRIEQHNLVTTAGKNLIRDRLNASAASALSHFAVGTSATAASSADTTLGAEVFRDTITGTTTASARLTVSYYLSSVSANGSTLREAGLFNASSSGTLYARVVLASTIVKTSSVAVTFTWDLTFT